jgi:hypothetical protein
MHWRQLWEYAATGGVPARSLAAALVVGTILNLINQGDALFAGKRLDWTKLLLTYVVPYCVTTYGAVSFRLAAARASGSRQHGDNNAGRR